MQKPYTSYNPYFLIPFLLWVITGGILVFSFDKGEVFRWVNMAHSSALDVLMFRGTMLGEGMVITLVLLMLLGMRMYRNWWYFTAALLCGILPSIITQIVKHQVNAPRPLKFFSGASWLHTSADWPQLMENSFPSGHTTGAFCMFTFLALLLTPKYRHWGVILFALALLVAYTRMYLAVHFLADVYVGSIIGTGFTLLVVALMNKYSNIFFKKA
ncbi:MAG: phosphatase PAP2 family protein [Chitinophagaceae bacterium]|nr:phosphatase PAP2 family protein [Chitinophagaceae bacterium]